MRKVLIACLAICLSSPVAGTNPARAATVLTVTFSGVVITSPLGYPMLNVSPTSGSGTFSSSVCAGTMSSTTKVTPAEADIGCSVVAAGTVGPESITNLGPWCGLTEGTWQGDIWLNKPGGSHQLYFFLGTAKQQGNEWHLIGKATKRDTGETGPIEVKGTLRASNPILTPAGGSCLSGTATHFDLSGTAELALV